MIQPEPQRGSTRDHDDLCTALDTITAHNDWPSVPMSLITPLQAAAERCGWDGEGDLILWAHARQLTYRRALGLCAQPKEGI